MQRLFETGHAQRNRQAFQDACSRSLVEEAETDVLFSKEGRRIMRDAQELRDNHETQRRSAKCVKAREYHAAAVKQLDAGLKDPCVARAWLAMGGRGWVRLLEFGAMPSARQLAAFGVPAKECATLSRLRLPRLDFVASADSKRSA
jgi:hypothetical protein